jgi:hypothetical protein
MRLRLWWRSFVARRKRKRPPHHDGGDVYRTPPSEAEFLAELIEAERLKPEPPRKYQREP